VKALIFIPIVLSLVVLGAHFMRYGDDIGVIGSLVMIGLLFLRRAWVARLIQVALVLGAFEWMYTLYELVQKRVAIGAPVTRMAFILGAVAAATAGAALLFQTKTMKKIYSLDRNDSAAD